MAGANAPVNVMLAIHAKKTVAVDLYKPLRQYVVQHFSEREAQDVDDDLHAVHQMRAEVERQSDTLEVRRDLLQRYFKTLTVMETRFPISPEKEHVYNLNFVWYDAFKQRVKTSQQNIHFEKAAIIFNIGAVLSQLGLAADRSTPSGLKTACHSFQSAAGAFAYLRDHVSMKASSGSSACSVDVSVECAGMLERLMLAQAQECFFEKVMTDNRPAMLCAKVARQVGVFYEEAHAALCRPSLVAHFDRPWVAHVQLKTAQFQAQALFRAAVDLHEEENIGEEIARLKAAQQLLVESKRQSKGVNPAIIDALSRLESTIARSLERANKENDRVYLMRVPAVDALAPIAASCLVKPWSMLETLDASGLKMFSTLVPDSSAKALSKYTEMVDEVIRLQTEKLQLESDGTRARLKEMEVGELLMALDGSPALPDGLREEVEAVQMEGGPRGLEGEMAKLRDMRRVCGEMFTEAEDALEKEAREDGQMRAQFGSRWSRPNSATLTKVLRDRSNGFAANLKQAGESDSRIERAIHDNESLLDILNHRPIEAALPILSKPMICVQGDEGTLPHRLRQSLNELEKLGSERADLEDMLKNMKQKDNILPRLMATTTSYEDLFQKELAKYDAPGEKIMQNIAQQGVSLKQIQELFTRFAEAYQVHDYKAVLEKTINQILQAVSKYREIRNNLNEGAKFYGQLQDALSVLKQQCEDFALTRGMQCRDIVEDLQRQMSNMRIESNPPPPQAAPQSGPQDQQGAYPKFVNAIGGLLGLQRSQQPISNEAQSQQQQQQPQQQQPPQGVMGPPSQPAGPPAVSMGLQGQQGQGPPQQQQQQQGQVNQPYGSNPPPYFAPHFQQPPQSTGYYGGPYPAPMPGGYAPAPSYVQWGGSGYYQPPPPPGNQGGNMQYPYYGSQQ